MDLTALRTFIETDLGDVPLQMMLDAANEDLTASVGPDTADVYTRDMEGERFLFLNRPATAVASITITIGGTTTTLAVSDWKLWGDKQLERLATGTNPSDVWCGRVDVSFTPGDLNRRNRAIVALVQLELDFRHGKKSETIGDHSMNQEDYDKARSKILTGARSWGFA